MKNFYWFVFLGIFALFGGVVLRFADEFSLVKQMEIKASLQANLISILKERKEEPVKIIFTGDIMLSRLVENRIYVKNDFKFPFLKVANFLRGADLTVGNLESPISLKGENMGSKYSFRAEPKTIEGLKFAGFDILSLANNHIWDYGEEAMSDTIYLLNMNGINTVGAGRDEREANRTVVKEIRGEKIAFLSFTNLYPESLEAKGERGGISDFDLNKIKEDIKKMKDSGEAEVVIVSLHFGEEYKKDPSDSKKEIARAVVEAGADLVVGHHPHVAQNLEKNNGVWIAYSLGNFVFDQDFSEETMKGKMFEAIIKNGQVISVRDIPIKINEDFQPELVDID